MATVSQWTPFGVALNITATGGTVTRTSATKYTVKINVSWKSYWDSARTNYGMTASSGGSTVTINTFGVKASSGSGTLTGTYSISGNGSATKTVTVTFRNFNTDNGDSATKNVSFSVKVPAWTSYTVKYNANGGSGAPSNQTKWKDQTLTLSSTKPTRTGYSFQGWATSSSGSVTYAAGGSYTTNAAVTLYAVWKANTYTVKYNANGGSGAPSNQTKTYGVTLTLSSTKPTRTNYTFKGWGTSSGATTVSYAAGGSYTTNASITLYAIWELAYKAPRITGVSVSRCTSNGTVNESGTYAKITASWICDLTVSSVIVEWKLANATTWSSDTVSASGTSGTISKVFGSDALSPESSYNVRITIADSNGSSTATTTLLSITFPIDIYKTGEGIAFGKSAEKSDLADFGFNARFNKHVCGNVLGLSTLPTIPENSDFNDYLITGCFAVTSNAVAETIANIPCNRAGRLEVNASTGVEPPSSSYAYLKHRYIPYDENHPVWERDVTRNGEDVWVYGDWYRSALSSSRSALVYHDPIELWAGGRYMTADHTINLSESINDQPNGIVLVFSKFADGAVVENNFNSFYVSKAFINSHKGYGNAFTMMDINFGQVCHKYLYISDTYITGHANNSATGTGSSGITYANNKYVLRYVYGV